MLFLRLCYYKFFLFFSLKGQNNVTVALEQMSEAEIEIATGKEPAMEKNRQRTPESHEFGEPDAKRRKRN